eukprot:249909_1
MPPPRGARDVDYFDVHSKSYNRSKYARRKNNRIKTEIYRRDYVHNEKKDNKRSRRKLLQNYTKFHKDQIKNNHHRIRIYTDEMNDAHSNVKLLHKNCNSQEEMRHLYDDVYHWYKPTIRPLYRQYASIGHIKYYRDMIIKQHCNFVDCVLKKWIDLGRDYFKILLFVKGRYNLWIHADVNVMECRPRWFRTFLINKMDCVAQKYQTCTHCAQHCEHTPMRKPIICTTCHNYCCDERVYRCNRRYHAKHVERVMNTVYRRKTCYDDTLKHNQLQLVCSYDHVCKACITKNEYDAMHGSLVSALQVTEHNLYPGLHVLDIITQYSLGVVEYCSNPQCDNELCVFDTQLEYIHYVKRHGKSPTRGMCIYGFCDECLWGSDWDLCKLPDKDQCESDNRYYKDTYDPDFQICHAFKNRTPEICYGYDAQHSQFENDLCRFISLSPSYVVLHAPSIPKRHYYKYNGSGFYVWIMEQERNGVSLPIMSKRMYRREWIYTKMCKCMATYFGYQKLLIEWVDRAIDFATYDLSQVIIEADPMETNMVDVEHSDPDVKAYSMTKYNRGRNKREDHKARIKRFKNHKWNDKKSNAKSKKRRLKRYCKITNENIKNGGSFV